MANSFSFFVPYEDTIQGGAPYLAKLVENSNNYGLW